MEAIFILTSDSRVPFQDYGHELGAEYRVFESWCYRRLTALRNVYGLTQNHFKIPQGLLQNYRSFEYSGRGSRVVKVSDRGWPCLEFEPSTTEDPTCRGAMPLNLSRAETSSRWCGVVVRRGECQLGCHPRPLTMVQNYVVRRQKPSCS
ncbi:hypothetical protein TNCV_1401851 [Trichonephila clavipes]|nr:hypothetical protein TNCV_1401851 [Trichonephila clavipes]